MEDLHAAFEKGNESIDTLSELERDLYWIMLFILEYEMGGLLYNWHDQRDTFQAVINATRRRGLSELSDIVVTIDAILQPTARLWEQNVALTWGEMQELIDPADHLRELQRRIDSLDNYGIPEKWPKIQ